MRVKRVYGRRSRGLVIRKARDSFSPAGSVGGGGGGGGGGERGGGSWWGDGFDNEASYLDHIEEYYDREEDRGWQQWWFVLVDGIFYYHGRDDGKLMGAIDLCLCTVSLMNAEAVEREIPELAAAGIDPATLRDSFLFKIVSAQHHYYLLADSEETRREWVHTMNQHIDTVRMNAITGEEKLLIKEKRKKELQSNPIGLNNNNTNTGNSVSNPKDQMKQQLSEHKKANQLILFNMMLNESLRTLYTEVTGETPATFINNSSNNNGAEVGQDTLKQEMEREIEDIGEIEVYLRLLRDTEQDLKDQLEDLQHVVSKFTIVQPVTPATAAATTTSVVPQSQETQTSVLNSPSPVVAQPQQQQRQQQQPIPTITTTPTTEQQQPTSKAVSNVVNMSKQEKRRSAVYLRADSNQTIKSGFLDLRSQQKKKFSKLFGRSKWSPVYLVLRNDGFLNFYASREAYDAGVEMRSIQLLLAAIRGFDGQGNKSTDSREKEKTAAEQESENDHQDQRYCFEIVTTERNYVLSIFSSKVRDGWVSTINECKRKLMDFVLKETVKDRHRSMLVSLQNGYSPDIDQALQGDQVSVQEIRKLDGNDKCADCHEPDAEWASLRFGVLVCIA
eukprot:TRINITY_DN7185_c0_g1_i1.p1 TRINITY_DN7185_c0_g1~~TRINITY_DN7185_c0_g1_i1.p1  ORF type:complete len:615 (-),score=156.94 TRINITY_DN7185_c0_g1_i1:188-2032(-)